MSQGLSCLSPSAIERQKAREDILSQLRAEQDELIKELEKCSQTSSPLAVKSTPLPPAIPPPAIPIQLSRVNPTTINEEDSNTEFDQELQDRDEPTQAVLQNAVAKEEVRKEINRRLELEEKKAFESIRSDLKQKKENLKQLKKQLLECDPPVVQPKASDTEEATEEDTDTEEDTRLAPDLTQGDAVKKGTDQGTESVRPVPITPPAQEVPVSVQAPEVPVTVPGLKTTSTFSTLRKTTSTSTVPVTAAPEVPVTVPGLETTSTSSKLRKTTSTSTVPATAAPEFPVTVAPEVPVTVSPEVPVPGVETTSTSSTLLKTTSTPTVPTTAAPEVPVPVPGVETTLTSSTLRKTTLISAVPVTAPAVAAPDSKPTSILKKPAAQSPRTFTAPTRPSTKDNAMAQVNKQRLRERLREALVLEEERTDSAPAPLLPLGTVTTPINPTEAFVAEQLALKEQIFANIENEETHMEQQPTTRATVATEVSTFAESYEALLFVNNIRVALEPESVKDLDVLFKDLLTEVLDRTYTLAADNSSANVADDDFSPITPYLEGSSGTTVSARHIVTAFVQCTQQKGVAVATFVAIIKDAIRAAKEAGKQPIFPAAALQGVMLDFDPSVGVSSRAAIALAASLQYVAGVLLMLASARPSRPTARKKTILASDIKSAIPSLRKKYGISFPSLNLDFK